MTSENSGYYSLFPTQYFERPNSSNRESAASAQVKTNHPKLFPNAFSLLCTSIPSPNISSLIFLHPSLLCKLSYNAHRPIRKMRLLHMTFIQNNRKVRPRKLLNFNTSPTDMFMSTIFVTRIKNVEKVIKIMISKSSFEYHAASDDAVGNRFEALHYACADC